MWSHTDGQVTAHWAPLGSHSCKLKWRQRHPLVVTELHCRPSAGIFLGPPDSFYEIGFCFLSGAVLLCLAPGPEAERSEALAGGGGGAAGSGRVVEQGDLGLDSGADLVLGRTLGSVGDCPQHLSWCPGQGAPVCILSSFFFFVKKK